MKAKITVVYTTTLDIGDVYPEVVAEEIRRDDETGKHSFNVWEFGDKVTLEDVTVEPIGAK